MPARSSSGARRYLRDIEPEWLAAEVARNFVEYVGRLGRAALGGAPLCAKPPPDLGADALLDTPAGRIARRLCRYARLGTGLDAAEAEALVKRYCELLADRVRGAVPLYAPSFRGRDELLMADMRSRGPDASEAAFPEMAEVLLATKARIYLAREEPIALRELAALASRPVNAVRRRILEDYSRRDLVPWVRFRSSRPAENRGVRVRPDAARVFLRQNGVAGFEN